MRRGFLYLVAVMDWASRKVLAWRLSNTMDSEFCVEALEEALGKYGKPDIFNTDQGSQFTSPRFTRILKEASVRISMDGKGRWMDNVFIERLWRSLKYECVYLHVFETGPEARKGIGSTSIARCARVDLVGRQPGECRMRAQRARGDWRLDSNRAKLNPAAGCPKYGATSLEAACAALASR